jgi:hypothetical protein
MRVTQSEIDLHGQARANLKTHYFSGCQEPRGHPRKVEWQEWQEVGPGFALGIHLEETSLDQRGLRSADVSNNHPGSRESENHKVGRAKVEEVFLGDN